MALTFEELDFGKQHTFYTDGDKEAQFVMSLFGGKINFTLWKNRKNEVTFSFTPLQLLRYTRRMTSFLLDNPQPESNFTINAQKWDNVGRKFNQNGTLLFGLDNEGKAFFGLTTPAGAQYKCPFSLGKAFAYSDDITPAEESREVANAFTDLVRVSLLNLSAFTKKKFVPGGDNTPSGGGNNNNAAAGAGGLF